MLIQFYVVDFVRYYLATGKGEMEKCKKDATAAVLCMPLQCWRACKACALAFKRSYGNLATIASWTQASVL